MNVLNFFSSTAKIVRKELFFGNLVLIYLSLMACLSSLDKSFVHIKFITEASWLFVKTSIELQITYALLSFMSIILESKTFLNQSDRKRGRKERNKVGFK